MSAPQPQPSALPVSPLARILAGRAQTSPPGGVPTRPASPTIQTANQLQAVPSPKRADLTHEGGETVSELFTQLKRTTAAFRNALVETAYYAYRLHTQAKDTDWGTGGALGFADEESAITSLGLTASSWDTFLLLGERLSSLSLAEMREFTASAARLLTTINAKIWPEYAWIEEARLLSTKEFAALIHERTQSSHSRALAEPKAALSLLVPLTLRDELEQRLNSLGRRERLRTPAEVLDFALRSAEKDPARGAAVLKLDQAAEELLRIWDAGWEDDTELAVQARIRKLVLEMRKGVKELKRNGIACAPSSLQTEVAEDQLAARADD